MLGDYLFGLRPPLRDLVSFAVSHMTRSYKPVLLSCVVNLADRNGRCSLEALTHQFYGFYLNRERLGLVVEKRPFSMDPPSRTTIAAVRNLVVRYPLGRLVLAGWATVAGDIVQMSWETEWRCVSLEERAIMWTGLVAAIARYYSVLDRLGQHDVSR